MNNSLRIGRILGVPLSIHWTVPLLVFLFGYSLGSQTLPAWLPGQSTTAYTVAGLTGTLLLLLSLLAHETAHALTARRKDIPVHSVKNVREGLHASRKVFPECFLPTRAELTEAGRGLFRVVEERNDPHDGVATVRSWLERAEANRTRGTELIGQSAVSDIIREQRTALRFLEDSRFTVHRP